jgi:hypothetical protein
MHPERQTVVHVDDSLVPADWETPVRGVGRLLLLCGDQDDRVAPEISDVYEDQDAEGC